MELRCSRLASQVPLTGGSSRHWFYNPLTCVRVGSVFTKYLVGIWRWHQGVGVGCGHMSVWLPVSLRCEAKRRRLIVNCVAAAAWWLYCYCVGTSLTKGLLNLCANPECKYILELGMLLDLCQEVCIWKKVISITLPLQIYGNQGLINTQTQAWQNSWISSRNTHMRHIWLRNKRHYPSHGYLNSIWTPLWAEGWTWYDIFVPDEDTHILAFGWRMFSGLGSKS